MLIKNLILKVGGEAIFGEHEAPEITYNPTSITITSNMAENDEPLNLSRFEGKEFELFGMTLPPYSGKGKLLVEGVVTSVKLVGISSESNKCVKVTVLITISDKTVEPVKPTGKVAANKGKENAAI